MPRPFPPIDAHDAGMLDVGDGQQIYWEVSGNPRGKPAVALHGGPGSGMSPGRRRSFDPHAYRLVQFDQRAAVGARRRSPTRPRRSTPTPPATWSPTSSGCASTWGSSAGSCGAAPGG